MPSRHERRKVSVESTLFLIQNRASLKAGVVKALWFEPTLNQTFAALAEHYDTTILSTRSRRPRAEVSHHAGIVQAFSSRVGASTSRLSVAPAGVIREM